MNSHSHSRAPAVILAFACLAAIAIGGVMLLTMNPDPIAALSSIAMNPETMMAMGMALPARGIMSARADTDPRQVLAKLSGEWADFRKRHTDDIGEVRSQLHDLAAGIASRGLNGPSAPEVPSREVSAAFRDYIRSGAVAGLNGLAANAGMSVGSDPEGGYTVYPTVSTGIMRRIFETSPLRAYARVVPIGSDSFEELLDLFEPDVAWVGETQARPETNTPDLGKLKIPVHEQYAMPKVTQKLLDDTSIDLAGWLIDKVGMKLGRAETSAFFSGNGVLKPRGFLTYPTAATADAARAWGVFEHVATGSSGAFGSTTNGSDKLIDTQAALKAEHRARAVWLMNRRTAAAVRKLKDGQGNFIWVPSLAAGQPDSLLGSPVVLCEDMPDVAADSLSIAYGDFSAGYTIVDRQGERVLRDPFTAKPHVLFYVYRRTGGDVSNFDAIKFLKFGS